MTTSPAQRTPWEGQELKAASASMRLTLFLGMLGAGVGALLLLLTLDLAASPLTWSQALSPAGFKEAMGSLAEVQTAILGLSLTVVAIVVQLASQRYSPKIVDLFMDDATNVSVFCFMIVTCIYVVMLPVLAGEDAAPIYALSGGMLLCVCNFAVLLPYFNHVFAFIQPENIITQIEQRALKSLRAVHHPRRDVVATRSVATQPQQQVASAVERIADNCVAALGQSDRRLALHCARSLERFVSQYLALKHDLPPSWARVPPQFFFTLSEEFYEEIVAQRAWVEAKTLMEFEHIFRAALGQMNELVSQVASSTRVIGEAALAARDHEAIALTIRFFNTYIRHALNARNVRAVYNVLYQYRRLSAAVMPTQPTICQKVVEHLVYYGRIANAMGLPFATVTTAHDVRVLCEVAFVSPQMNVSPLLELFLSLDQDPEGKTEELALMGVRKAQSILGAFFLARGATELAQRIRVDMQDDSLDRLRRIRDEILDVKEHKFWEVTDRGFNFDYVEDEMRPMIVAFFDPLLGAKAQEEGAERSSVLALAPPPNAP
jgi:hypothetical protein